MAVGVAHTGTLLGLHAPLSSVPTGAALQLLTPEHLSAPGPLSDNVYVTNLRRASDRIAGLPLTIVIEPINNRDIPGYLMNSFDLAAQLIADLGLPNLKLQFDIYHRQILHGDVATSLASLMPLIGHVQTASVPKRNEPGTGELNDDFLFRRLDELGYDGYVGCEYRPAAGTREGLGWFKKWRPARAT